MEYTHTYTQPHPQTHTHTLTQTHIKPSRSPEANARGLGTPQMKKKNSAVLVQNEENYNTANIL